MATSQLGLAGVDGDANPEMGASRPDLARESPLNCEGALDCTPWRAERGQHAVTFAT
jgi:hypothetical protein